MENHPTPTIDMTAVELHRPPDELINELEAMAALYERSFILHALGRQALQQKQTTPPLGRVA